MSKLNVNSTIMPPSFLRFMNANYKKFGLEWTSKELNGMSTTYVDESKSISFTVLLDQDHKVMVDIHVTTPPPYQTPEWLQAFLDEYERVLTEWTGGPDVNLEIRYVYN